MSFQLDQKIVFCQNPFDIRQALEDLLSTKNWILKRLPKDVPLIIIFGEYHDRPSNIALQQAFIEKVAKDDHVAVGFEKPPSELNKAILLEGLTRAFENKFSPFFDKKSFTAEKRNDRLSGRISKSHIYAPISTRSLLNMCFKRNVSIRFNDLEKTRRFFGSHYLAALPSTNRELMSKNEMSITEKLFTPTRSAKGIDLRKQGIVSNAIDHLEQTEAKVYVQRIGLDHVDDSNAANITKQFQNAGYSTLTVCLDNDFSARAIPKPRTNSMIVRGLSDNGFGSGVYNPRISMAEFMHWVKINRQSGCILEL